MNTLNKLFLSYKILATVSLLAAGLANSIIRPHGGLVFLDALGQGTAIYVIWLMGGRKPKDDSGSNL